jgi:hypothetical protein
MQKQVISERGLLAFGVEKTTPHRGAFTLYSLLVWTHPDHGSCVFKDEQDK